MTDLRVVGIDPGPTPGIVVLEFELVGTPHRAMRRAAVVQCSHNALRDVLAGVLRGPGWTTFVQVERFVTRGRANAAQSLTRDQVAELQSAYGAVPRTASQVKAWATDTRLEAAGLLEACKGMRHARDAARHALFAAVHDGAIPDPLSKEWNR